MTLEPQIDPLPRSMQERFPPRRRSLRGLWWALITQVQKKRIAWEDSAGHFTYTNWIKTVEQAQIHRLLYSFGDGLTGKCSVLFVISGGDVSEQALKRTVGSVQRQAEDWQAVLLLPESSTLRREGWFLNMLQAEPRLRAPQMDLPAGPYGWMRRLNDVVGPWIGDWLISLRVGDELAEAWSDVFPHYALRSADADIIYWDEDLLSEDGQRMEPFFKPDWSPELLLSLNYLGSAAFRGTFLKVIGSTGVSAGLIFEVTDSARRIGHIPVVMIHHQALSSEACALALAEHAEGARAALEQLGGRDVHAGPAPDGALRLSWTVNAPLVSIIIPTRDHFTDIKRCLNTLLERTTGVPYEIIVMDDHSRDPQVFDYYRALEREHSNIHVAPSEGEFNYSAVNNAGARLAHGDLLLFLNNDVEVTESGWLAEMTRWVCLPGVGVAGAKLLYPDGRIQHAGIVLGMTGHAGHIYAGQESGTSSLFLSPDVTRDVSAVTGACMLVRRDVFETLGGFDEELVLVFNDVDFCLRVLRAGYRVVYAPSARLIHYEGRSRAHYIPPHDIRLGAERLFAEIQAGDRYYNPNLSLAVNWPTLRRQDEPGAAKRLCEIVGIKG